MWPNPQFPAHLVTFTEEILDRRLHFLCSVIGLLKVFEKWFHYFSHIDLLFSFVKTGKVFHKLRLEIFWFNKVADFLNQHFLSGQIDTKKKTNWYYFFSVHGHLSSRNHSRESFFRRKLSFLHKKWSLDQRIGKWLICFFRVCVIFT